MKIQGNVYKVEVTLPTPQTKRIEKLGTDSGIDKPDLLRRLFDLGLPKIVASLEKGHSAGKRNRRLAIFLAFAQGSKLASIVRRSRLSESEALSRILDAGLAEYESTKQWPEGYGNDK